MEDNHRKRVGELAKMMFGGYLLLRDVLAALPLPIGVPTVEDLDPDTAPAVLAQTRELVGIEPIDDRAKRLLDGVILDVLTITDLLSMAEINLNAVENTADTDEPDTFEEWRLDAASRGIIRMGAYLMAVAPQFGINPTD